MADLELSLAVSDYDHVRDLCSGLVPVEGVALKIDALSVGEIFQRVMRAREWDVHEMSLGMYVALLAQGDTSLTAIPIFTSRMFRQSAFHVHADSPLRSGADLRGKRIGTPDWATTAGIWARGWLRHDIGIDVTEIDWVQAGLNAPGRVETLQFQFPQGMRRTTRPECSLADLLAKGEIDAILSPQLPQGAVRRLIGDVAAAERAYAVRTGLFPIMHCVAIKRDIAAANPWLASRLYAAFDTAKARSQSRMRDPMASRFPNPWAWQADADARALFGGDPWPYGVTPNRASLEAFLDYCAEQGVGGRRVRLEELFETVG